MRGAEKNQIKFTRAQLGLNESDSSGFCPYDKMALKLNIYQAMSW